MCNCAPVSYEYLFSNANWRIFEMIWVVTLLLICHLRFLSALWCNDSEKGEPCCGDFCYTERAKSEKSGAISIERKGCLQGGIYRLLRNKCFNDKARSYCICDGDYCNGDDSFFPGWKKGSLNCSNPNQLSMSASQTTECNECSHQVFDEVFAIIGTKMSQCRTLAGYYEDYSLMSTPTIPWMQPKSCMRLQIKGSHYIQCLCETGNHCGMYLASEQKLNSTKVTCYYKEYNRWNDDGNKTCQGDVCYMSKGPWDETWDERGCITNNETLYPGLLQSGYATFRDREYILCATNECNENWETAKEAVNFKEPSCAIATTTMNESEMIEAEFRIEWASLLKSISNAFNEFISQFHGTHG